MEIYTVKDLRDLLEKLPDDARVDFSLGCNKSEDQKDEEFELSYLYQIFLLLYYGAIGCALFFTERDEWNGETYPIISVKAVIVDGKDVKADTWYKLVNGELVECED